MSDFTFEFFQTTFRACKHRPTGFLHPLCTHAPFGGCSWPPPPKTGNPIRLLHGGLLTPGKCYHPSFRSERVVTPIKIVNNILRLNNTNNNYCLKENMKGKRHRKRDWNDGIAALITAAPLPGNHTVTEDRPTTRFPRVPPFLMAGVSRPGRPHRIRARPGKRHWPRQLDGTRKWKSPRLANRANILPIAGRYPSGYAG